MSKSYWKTWSNQIAERDGSYTCAYCGAYLYEPSNAPATPFTGTIDHVIPRSKGGTTTLDNLVLACHSCNTNKSNMTERQWRQAIKERRFKSWESSHRKRN